jgi:hypothetical protein
MNDVPTDGARDLGGPEWEQDLVRRLREKNLAWNIQKTYRSWCRRFMTFIGGKPFSELKHHDVRDWLPVMAGKERVAVATQAQAWNCLERKRPKSGQKFVAQDSLSLPKHRDLWQTMGVREQHFPEDRDRDSQATDLFIRHLDRASGPGLGPPAAIRC